MDLQDREVKDDDWFFENLTPPSKKQKTSSSFSSDIFNSSACRALSFNFQPAPKTFQDSVHGCIMLDPLLVAIIDTPQFQRLRDIKQLGVGYWVFPGACHNRFEHCIGTSYLSGRMLSKLKSLHKNVYNDPIDITKKDILCVKIAGLCHDLGHGPFSHCFDGTFIPMVKPSSEWTHEQASCDLFDYMLDVNPQVANMFEEYGIGYDDKQLIKGMIMGKPLDDQLDEGNTMVYKGQKYKKQFLYEIISNKATGIDCDKFDYFERDTHHVGIKNSFDFKRYFKNIRILPIDGQLRICSRDKEESNLYELFHIRWTLHRQVYQHKTLSPVHDLLMLALKEADKVLGISSSIDHMERYTYMTDSILFEILRSNNPALEKAKEYLNKVQSRNLYHYCGEINPDIVEDPENQVLSFSQNQLVKEDVQKGIAECGKNISIDDIFVSQSYFSYGKKNQNPLANIQFFGKDGKLKKPQLNELSSLHPIRFEEKYIRVYCKTQNKSFSVKKAFAKWCNNQGYRTTETSE